MRDRRTCSSSTIRPFFLGNTFSCTWFSREEAPVVWPTTTWQRNDMQPLRETGHNHTSTLYPLLFNSFFVSFLGALGTRRWTGNIYYIPTDWRQSLFTLDCATKSARQVYTYQGRTTKTHTQETEGFTCAAAIHSSKMQWEPNGRLLIKHMSKITEHWELKAISYMCSCFICNMRYIRLYIFTYCINRYLYIYIQWNIRKCQSSRPGINCLDGGIKSQANTYVCISMYANSNGSLANCQMSSKFIFCVSSHHHCRKKKVEEK